MKGRRVSARATELFYGCMRYYYDGGKAIALLLCSPFCLVSGILDPPFSFLLVGVHLCWHLVGITRCGDGDINELMSA